MKKYFILLIATVLSICAFAQDVIVTKDSKKIDAKILEVSKSEIKYKEADNLEGPTFVLEVDDINSIIYSNGKVVLYNDQQSVKNTIQQEPLVREETKQTVIVDFGIKPTSNPLMYRFPNLSSGAVDFRWDFGDGTFALPKTKR